MNDIKEYQNVKKWNEISHFFGQVSNTKLRKIVFLKSLNDEEELLILNKIKRILNSKYSLRVIFIKSDEPYNFEKLDSESIVEATYCFHEIYLVTDEEENSWFLVIRNNNFFQDGNNIELAYSKKTDKFISLWHLLFKKIKQPAPISVS
jgi:hypothetical protein